MLTSGYTADTAIALADTAAETGTSRMLYVQITADYRSTFGLLTNPTLRGRQVTATGTLTAYFSHGGLKSPTAMSLGGGSTPTPTATAAAHPAPTGSTGPYDSTYYANAVGKTGTALRGSLHTIIRAQTKLSYDQVWDALKDTDQDPANANNVILLYSGRSQSKTQQRRRGQRLEPGARLGQVARRLRHRHRAGHRRAPPAPGGRHGQLRRAATRTSTPAAARSPRPPAATPTPTRSSPATRSRATSPA